MSVAKGACGFKATFCYCLVNLQKQRCHCEDPVTTEKRRISANGAQGATRLGLVQLWAALVPGSQDGSPLRAALSALEPDSALPGCILHHPFHVRVTWTAVHRGAVGAQGGRPMPSVGKHVGRTGHVRQDGPSGQKDLRARKQGVRRKWCVHGEADRPG